MKENQMASHLHCVRLSIFGKEQVFSPDDAGLSSEADGVTERVPYSDISQVALITYAGAGGRQGQMTIRTKSNRKFKIRSHHYKSLGLFENRSSTYAPFVRELTERVAIANPAAEFKSGSNVYWVVWWVLTIALSLLAVLLSLALLSGEPLKGNVIGGLILLLVLIPFSWRNVRGNRQATFDPGNVPIELIEL